MSKNKNIIKALKISNINVDNIVVGQKKNNKTIPITLSGEDIVCQTPFLEIKGSMRKTSFTNIYQIDTLFKGDDQTKIDQWYQFIENIESKITNQIITKGSKWFTQKDVFIKSLIREQDGDKNQYPKNELCFIKWPIDLQMCSFIDEEKKSFNPLDIKDGDCIKLIIEISNLWIDNNQFGLVVVVRKILVKQRIEKIESEYIFDESEKTEEDVIISLLATEQKKNLKINNNTVVELVEKDDKIKHSKTLKNQIKQVISDDSENNLNFSKPINKFINDYNSSSDEDDEINEDDLDFYDTKKTIQNRV